MRSPWTPRSWRCFFGSLLHDIGVTPAGANLCRVAGVDEGAIFGPAPLRVRDEDRADLVFADRESVQEALARHCVLGAETVRALELPEEAAIAVAAHHEFWDGNGYPEGLAGEAIPIEGRIVAVADAAEVLIAEQFSSLVARRHFHSSISQYSGGGQLDPRIVTLLLELAKSDEFWLGLYSRTWQRRSRRSAAPRTRARAAGACCASPRCSPTCRMPRGTTRWARAPDGRERRAPGERPGPRFGPRRDDPHRRAPARRRTAGRAGARDDQAGHSLCDRDALDASAPANSEMILAGTARV